MHRNSNKATRFVAVAHFRDRPDNREDVGTLNSKTATFTPDATIEDIYAAFWPAETDIFGEVCFRSPYRIEILPDETTVPPIEMPSFLDNKSEVD